MKKCLKCKSDFPIIYKIDGKNHNLSKRKFCLDCSPFKAHNTKNLVVYELIQTKKTCPKCKTEKPIEDFYRRRNDANCSVYCKVCTTDQTIERQRNLKQKSVEYLGGKCKNCGYDKYLGALDFHHIDPAQKSFSLGHNKLYSFDKIKSELDKCILLCANCHREFHGGIIELPPI